MDQNQIVAAMRGMKDCFDRSTACLSEEDSACVPAEGMYSAAQQIAHVAQTIEWFVDGAFSPGGFDLDFGKNDANGK